MSQLTSSDSTQSGQLSNEEQIEESLKKEKVYLIGFKTTNDSRILARQSRLLKTNNPTIINRFNKISHNRLFSTSAPNFTKSKILDKLEKKYAAVNLFLTTQDTLSEQVKLEILRGRKIVIVMLGRASYKIYFKKQEANEIDSGSFNYSYYNSCNIKALFKKTSLNEKSALDLQQDLENLDFFESIDEELKSKKADFKANFELSEVLCLWLEKQFITYENSKKFRLFGLFAAALAALLTELYNQVKTDEAVQEKLKESVLKESFVHPKVLGEIKFNLYFSTKTTPEDTQDRDACKTELKKMIYSCQKVQEMLKDDVGLKKLIREMRTFFLSPNFSVSKDEIAILLRYIILLNEFNEAKWLHKQRYFEQASTINDKIIKILTEELPKEQMEERNKKVNKFRFLDPDLFLIAAYNIRAKLIACSIMKKLCESENSYKDTEAYRQQVAYCKETYEKVISDSKKRQEGMSNSDAANLYNGLAYCYIYFESDDKESTDTALDHFKKARELNKHSPFILSGLGICYFNIGKLNAKNDDKEMFETALIFLTQAFELIKDEKNETSAIINICKKLAEVHQHLKCRDKALEYYKKVLKYSKLDMQANINIAKILIEKGEFAEAEKYFKNALCGQENPQSSIARKEIQKFIKMLRIEEDSVKKGIFYQFQPEEILKQRSSEVGNSEVKKVRENV